MRKKWLWPLLMTAVLLLAACGSRNTEPVPEISGPTVYYLSENGVNLMTAPCNTEHSGEEEIRDLFNTLKNGEFTDGHTALPLDLELAHIAWQEDSLVLYLTGTYPEMGTREETLCRAVLTLTMLSMEGVESVRINVNEEPLTDSLGREVGAIGREAFMMNLRETPAEREVITLTLYFAGEDGKSLVKETISSETNPDDSIPSVVMDMLIKGPLDKSHLPTLPAGSGVLSISVKDGICYVNFNETFRSGESQLSDELKIFSVVNSLTELPEVDKVQITVNGSADLTFGEGISISSPLGANTLLVQAEPEEGAGETDTTEGK